MRNILFGSHLRAFRPGFALVELLLVVAIVALLTAIAVPSFHDAHTRSMVSSVRADMRAFSIGIEAYRADNQGRTFRTIRNSGETREFVYSRLTTPVAYLPSVPRDPFCLDEPNPGNRVITLFGPDYVQSVAVGAGRILFSPYPEVSDGTAMLRTDFRMLLSAGPNLWYDFSIPWPSPIHPYDATNGTISRGDITRLD